jgi:3-methyladenine DNA glycosylase/8-oxoguanine DNA glycosylase
VNVAALRARSLALLAGLALGACGGGSDGPAPITGDCSIPQQNQAVYDTMQQYYLWYEELPQLDPRGFASPEALLALPVESLRGAGFSAAKVLALRDIATRAMDGSLPPRRVLARWEDERIVDQLVQIRGVGRWTVQMLLIFTLGRRDVLPVDDYGVRNGFRLAYGLDRLPTPRELGDHGLRWAPERSAAAWYLWRAVDLERAAG